MSVPRFLPPAVEGEDDESVGAPGRFSGFFRVLHHLVWRSGRSVKAFHVAGPLMAPAARVPC